MTGLYFGDRFFIILPLRLGVSSHERIFLSSHVRLNSRSRRAAALAQPRSNGTLLAIKIFGGVVEWFMAPVLKTGRPKGLVGSNPTPSATTFSILDFRLSIARKPKRSFEHDARGSASGRLHSRSGSGRAIGRSRDQ